MPEVGPVSKKYVEVDFLGTSIVHRKHLQNQVYCYKTLTFLKCSEMPGFIPPPQVTNTHKSTSKT